MIGKCNSFGRSTATRIEGFYGSGSCCKRRGTEVCFLDSRFIGQRGLSCALRLFFSIKEIQSGGLATIASQTSEINYRKDTKIVENYIYYANSFEIEPTKDFLSNFTCWLL